MESRHEMILPIQGLPFKMFIFEGKDGNYSRGKHWHSSVEIFAVFEGDLVFKMNEEEYILRSDEFMLVNSNEIHAIDAPCPNRTVVIQIPLKVFEAYYTGEEFIRFTHNPKSHDKKVMSLVSDIYEAYDRQFIGYELKIQSLFYMLLYFMVTKYRESEASLDMLRKNQKLSRLSVITSYIKEHYTEDISLEGLAEIFGYSPTYLSKLFQKYGGGNYRPYLQNVRLEHAYRELSETDWTLGEIAMKNGFSDSRALAKAFRRKYGILPSEYRKMTRK